MRAGKHVSFRGDGGAGTATWRAAPPTCPHAPLSRGRGVTVETKQAAPGGLARSAAAGRKMPRGTGQHAPEIKFRHMCACSNVLG